MRDHALHRPAKELEIAIFGDRMHLRISGSGTFVSIPFIYGKDQIPELEKQYAELGKQARIRGKGARYKQKEAAFGHTLGAILFKPAQGVGQGKQLAAILDDCLRGLDREEYVRLLLSFEDQRFGNLPWELASWESFSSRPVIGLGRDRRIALSRLQQGLSEITRRGPFGEDGVFSVLHVSAEGSSGWDTKYELTKKFLHLIEDHIPRLHTVSRRSPELQQYWRDSGDIMGQPPEMDIVHWEGHGNARSIEIETDTSNKVTISAPALIERTGGAFLYVMLTCGASGQLDTEGAHLHTPAGVRTVAKRSRQQPKKLKANPADRGNGDAPPDSFSAALLNAGAAAVLGPHGVVVPEEFGYLPILYPLLFQGLPLDYCVQFMRRFFARRNADCADGPYDRWYKLMLRTTSAQHLDGTLPITPVRHQNPVLLLYTLREQFQRSIERRGQAAKMDEPQAAMDFNGLLKQLSDTEFSD